MMSKALHLRVTKLVMLAGLGLASFGYAQNNELDQTQYTVPHFGGLSVAVDDSSVPVEGLITTLLDVSDLKETDADTRGKALALAYALGSRREVIIRDYKFRFRQPLKPNAYYDLPPGMVPDFNSRVPLTDSPAFRYADKNGDGILTKEEAGPLWNQLVRMDTNRDDRLSVSETRGQMFQLERTMRRPTIDGTKASLTQQLQRVSEEPVGPYLHDIFNSLEGERPRFGYSPPDWTAAFPDTSNGGDPIANASDRPTGTVGRGAGRIYFEQIPHMSNSGEPAGGFKRRQSMIKGLLVIQLEGSQFAGGASQMNATVRSGSEGEETEVSFNQEVGESMESGLVKVLQFINQKHGKAPDGQQIEISFESQYSPKDGDSASTACALLINSLITGEDLDSKFAVTGALSMDGDVEAVGGIDGKIRGATNRDCTHVAIPEVNADVLSDMLITDGIGPLAAIQVFTIDTFDSAHALAMPPDLRDANLNEAIEQFATVQKVLMRNNGAAMLKNVQVQQRLRGVIDLAPNHASAKLLLLKALGRSKEQLTLVGSLTAIDRAALPLIQGLRNQDYRSGANALDSDEFGKSVSNLKRIRPQLDKRAWSTADAIVEFAEAFRTLRNNPPKSPKALSELGGRIETAGNRVERHYGELAELIRRKLEFERGE